ncbi:MAG: hypothetical protein Fur002_26390 [Anaerolineales bacterium]
MKTKRAAQEKSKTKKAQTTRQPTAPKPIEKKIVRKKKQSAPPQAELGLQESERRFREMPKNIKTERVRAEEALRESEREYWRLIDLLPSGVVVHTGGKIILANSASAKFFGAKDAEQLIGSALIERVHPDYRVAVLNRVEQSTQKQIAAPLVQEKLLRLDGSAFDAEVAAMPILYAGKPSMLAMFNDITERKLAEDKLAASEAELRALFASMQDVVMVIDRDGMYRKIAPANPSLLVKPPEDLLGKTLRDVFPAEQTEAFLETIHQTLETRQTTQIEYELKIGERAVWFSASISFMDAENTVWVARDVTARKLAEDKMRLLTSGLEAAANSVVITDKDGVIQWVNPAYSQLTGYSAEEAIGQTPRILKSGMQPIEFYKNLWDTILAGKVWRSELINKRKDGSFYSEEESVTPVIAANGEITHFIAIKEDITERKRAEEELRQRVIDLETLNRISIALRAATSQDAMLAIVLEETLSALNMANGAIELWDEASASLQKVMAHGWLAETTARQKNLNEGIAAKVFADGEAYISREFASDANLREESRSQIPAGWGGICAPIRSPEKILGTLLISAPSGREFDKNEIRLISTLAEMTGNAVHRMRLHEETERRLENLQALHTIDRAISSSFDLRQSLSEVLHQVVSQLGVDAADALIFNPILQTLDYAAGQGFRARGMESAHLRLSEGYAGRAALERRTIHVSDISKSASEFKRAALLADEHFVEYYAAPLISKGEIKGVLEIFHRAALHPAPEWLEFLEILAGQAAIAIDNSQLFENLQHSNLELALAYDATIEGWSRALDLRDKETEGHTLRVTEMALELARAMGVGDEELIHIRRGALLHDIGKMGVPDSILLKPGKLTDEEWVVMRKHPQFAYEMLASIEYLKRALDIPYCHHEKWDGTGYPRGLKGEQIPLAARLFAVIDVWDALRSDRAYRKGWTEEKTLEYIRSLAGTHFDPAAVEAFLKMEEDETRNHLAG